MLILSSLKDIAVRSGILPYYCIFPGDHRACFLDLDTTGLFAGSTAPLAPPCQCSLHFFDPRKVSKYKFSIYNQLQYHKVVEKCSDVVEVASKNQWTPVHTDQYECLDSIITQTMLFAEADLKNAVEVVRFRRLLWAYRS